LYLAESPFEDMFCPASGVSRLKSTKNMSIIFKFPNMQTSIFGVTVGISCSFYAPVIVAQAIFITAAVVGALTAYTFWATRKGVEFTWLAPLLFSGLWALIIWGFIQIFFHPGPISQMIYSLIGALIFCGYIVFDVHLLATRYDVDEYIWASVALYLDIINLFMHILRIVGQAQDNR